MTTPLCLGCGRPSRTLYCPRCQVPEHGRRGSEPEEPKPRRGRMNRTEAAYAAEVMEPRLRAGDLVGWTFEGIKLRLADGTWYTPDFVALTASGHIECHEVKGHLREAAGVRFNVAAEAYPWMHFRMVRREGAGWRTIREYAMQERVA